MSNAGEGAVICNVKARACPSGMVCTILSRLLQCQSDGPPNSLINSIRLAVSEKGILERWQLEQFVLGLPLNRPNHFSNIRLY
jgi:hypothetical protein